MWMIIIMPCKNIELVMNDVDKKKKKYILYLLTSDQSLDVAVLFCHAPPSSTSRRSWLTTWLEPKMVRLAATSPAEATNGTKA
jgi:hypothetical protein